MFHHEDGSTVPGLFQHDGSTGQSCFIMRTVLFNMHVSSWGAVLLVRPVSPWGGGGGSTCQACFIMRTVLFNMHVSSWGRFYMSGMFHHGDGSI